MKRSPLNQKSYFYAEKILISNFANSQTRFRAIITCQPSVFDTDKIINIRIGYAYCIRSTCTVDYQQNKQHQHSSQYSFQHPKYLPSQNIEQYYSSKHLRIIIIISLLFVYINIYYLSDIYYDRR